jgi:hypothetical protein
VVKPAGTIDLAADILCCGHGQAGFCLPANDDLATKTSLHEEGGDADWESN